MRDQCARCWAVSSPRSWVSHVRRVATSSCSPMARTHLVDWMHRHLSLSWVDVLSPRGLEDQLSGALNLPLNLEGHSRNAFQDAEGRAGTGHDAARRRG